MKKVKALLKVEPGDFIYKSGNLAIVQFIEVIDNKIHFKMDDGSIIVEKITGNPSRLQVFRIKI